VDVDGDDEYMNAAAAHTAFFKTVSAASMYWLLRHAQHARDINIHKLHPLPEKNRLGPLCRFSAQWNTSLREVLGYCSKRHGTRKPSLEVASASLVVFFLV